MGLAIIGYFLLTPDLTFLFLGCSVHSSIPVFFVRQMCMENLLFPGPVLVIIDRNKTSVVIGIGYFMLQ